VEDYFEEEEEEEQQQQQQQQASAEVATINIGQQKSPAHLCCHLCSSHGQRKGTQSAKCDVGLCVVPCFAEYRTKVNL
jgi:hypothetical protein